MNLEDSSDSELEGEEIIRNLEEEGKTTVDLVPTRSKAQYERRYNEFIFWQKNNKSNSFTEDVFLVYFTELSQTRTPSTLWSIWSMLRATMFNRHNINLDMYCHLKAFIKMKAKGYRPKKPRVLTLAQVQKFLNDADDTVHLATKVVLIIGICGAMRNSELVNFEVTNLEDHGTIFVGKIEDNKNNYPRSFIIGKEHYDIVQKYIKLRPKDFKNPRFFINYQNGKCTHQVIGKNKISDFPKIIARLLQLPDPEKYTGHCFRRTSATLLGDFGANLTPVKQLGGWRSSTAAEGISRAAVPTQAQLEKLLDYLEDQRWLGTGHARTARARDCSRAAWQVISDTLNGDDRGCSKTWQQWSKYWKDKKAAIKKKASLIKMGGQKTGGMDDVQLSPIEERILGIMGVEDFTLGDREFEETTNEHLIPVETMLSEEPQPGPSCQRENSKSVPNNCSQEVYSRPNMPVTRNGSGSPKANDHSTSLSSRRFLTAPRLRRLASQKRPLMARFTERLLAIEERRVANETILAQNQQALVQVLQQMSEAWLQQSQALCDLVRNTKNERDDVNSERNDLNSVSNDVIYNEINDVKIERNDVKIEINDIRTETDD